MPYHYTDEKELRYTAIIKIFKISTNYLPINYFLSNLFILLSNKNVIKTKLLTLSYIYVKLAGLQILLNVQL